MQLHLPGNVTLIYVCFGKDASCTRCKIIQSCPLNETLINVAEKEGTFASSVS